MSGATLSVLEPATERGAAPSCRGPGSRRPTPPSRAPARPSRPGARSRPATAPPCCAASPMRSRPAPRSSPRSRRATPASRSPTPAARWGWSSRRSATTPGAPERLLGDTIPVAGGVDMTFREPLGVVGLITPWNFPLTIASWKLAPALAAGNTVVLKPAELTPLTALELERIALEAGLPEGVVNVVVGPGSVVRASGSSSTPTSRRSPSRARPRWAAAIAAGAAATIKRVTLELGGKSANVVFADADLERAAAAAPAAVFGNAGQDCCARSRILVERSALDAFMDALEERRRGRRASATRSTERTEMGPLISAGPARDGRLLRARRRAGGDPRRAPPTGPASGSRPPCWPRCPTTTARRARRSSARSRACIPFARRGGGRPRSPTTRSTGSRARSGPATARGRCAWRARSRPASCRSTRTRSVRVATPFGGFKQSGVGRELGPARARALHRGQERLLRDGGLSRMAGRLEGKVCVITGAAGGIGAETARLLRRGGRARGRRRPARRRGGRRSRSQADVTDEDAGQRRCTRDAREALRPASTCCSTTPASRRPTTARCSTRALDAWQRVQDVNLKRVFLCCKHGIPHLLEGGGGSVINTASFVAVMGAATSQIVLHRVQGRRARRSRASWAWSSRAGACGSTRCARAR